MAKFFYYPFGYKGDKTAVPDASQDNGSVSYYAGFGSNYQLPLASGGAALPINRGQFNAMMNDVTGAIQNIQTQGVFSWIGTSPSGDYVGNYPYPINALVYYTDGNIYQSLIADNQNIPGADATWAIVGNVSQLQNSTPIYAVDTGTANTYAVAPTPAFFSLVAGSTIYMLAAHTNTGGSTLNVSSLGTKNILISTVGGLKALVGNEIIAGGLYTLRYDGTQWQLLNSSKPLSYVLSVYQTAQQNISNNSITVLTYDTNAATGGANPAAAFDNSYGTMTSNVTSGGNPYSITANVAGIFEIETGINLAALPNTGAGGAYIAIYKNGSLLRRLSEVGNSSTGNDISLNGLFKTQLAVGDYIQVQVYQNTATTINTSVNTATNSWFQMTYLGM